MFESSGIIDRERLLKSLPDASRRAKGKYALIECFQEIPCNPCSVSCPFSAIRAMDDMNQLPEIDYERCSGCGLCAAICPGLAIYIIDESVSGDEVLLTLPYEFLPLPQVGDLVRALDREGKDCGSARVVALRGAVAEKREKIEKEREEGRYRGRPTPLVTMAVPREQFMDLRFFRLAEPEPRPEAEIRSAAVPAQAPEDEAKQAPNEAFPPPEDEANNLLCRCEGIRLEEIRQLIREGYHSVDEIKHICRAGMGPCQGKTCRHLILQELSRYLKQDIHEMEPGAFRPPARPIELGKLIAGKPDGASEEDVPSSGKSE